MIRLRTGFACLSFTRALFFVINDSEKLMNELSFGGRKVRGLERISKVLIIKYDIFNI